MRELTRPEARVKSHYANQKCSQSITLIEARQASQEIKDFCFATDMNIRAVLSGLLHFEAKYLNRFTAAFEDGDREGAMLYYELVHEAKSLYQDKLQEH